MDDELNTRLKPLRERIDAIDAQLIALLNQRAAVALEVGEVKKHFNAPVFRPEREQQVIARLQDMSDGPLADDHISCDLARNHGREPCARTDHQGRVSRAGRARTANRRCTSTSVSRSKVCRVRRSTKCFRSVEAGAAEFGVVPVENSTEGAVSRTLDLAAANVSC